MADPAVSVSICADLLRGGFATPARVAAYLNDAESAELAAQLAERRGTMSFAGVIGEQPRARITNLAARALAMRLTDPDQLHTTLAAIEGADEMVQIAVGLARRRMRGLPAYRPVEQWERDPADRRHVIERDPVTGHAMGLFASTADREPDAFVLEERRRANLTACSRGAHTYGEVDPESGWSTCRNCRHVLVVDRRFGPGSRLPGPSEFARG